MRLILRLLSCAVLLGMLGWPGQARAEESRYFVETGYSVRGDFLAFFKAHGGLVIFGYPRSEEYVENGRTVQYFQRARFEWWPENSAAEQVQLGPLGSELGKDEPGLAPEAASPAARFFAETGHTLRGTFLSFWQMRGGPAIFGYPISEERDEDGQRIQYFERARFEMRPGNMAPSQVQLGLLGDELLTARGELATPRAVVQPAAAASQESGRQGRLVYQETSGGNIYTMNVDGGELTLVGQGVDPVWSPDGTRIAFARWDYPAGIYLMNADGSDLARIMDVEQAQGLQWSPDGVRLIFYSKYIWSHLEFDRRRDEWVLVHDDQWKLTQLDVNTREFADLPRQFRAFSPSWAPDSKTVVYKGDRGLYTSAIGEESALIPNTDTRFVSPSWSPTGDRIAFMWRQHDHWEIGIINPSGGGFRLLTSFKPFTKAANNVGPIWSPDGSEIAFLSDREGEWKMYVMSADGSNQRKLNDAPVDYRYAYERVFSWVK